MSLRSYSDQIKVEEEAEAAFRRDLGPAAAHFDAMTPDEVRETVRCPVHRVGDGVYCGFSHGEPFNCITRRKAAAIMKAERR